MCVSLVWTCCNFWRTKYSGVYKQSATSKSVCKFEFCYIRPILAAFFLQTTWHIITNSSTFQGSAMSKLVSNTNKLLELNKSLKTWAHPSELVEINRAFICIHLLTYLLYIEIEPVKPWAFRVICKWGFKGNIWF